MCRPLYFQVNYQINPWMKPGSVNTENALNQWSKLVETYKKLRVNVNILDQEKGLPDMVFAADQGISVGNKILVSNFRHKERRGESAFYKKWYKKNNINTSELPKEIYFEGEGIAVKFENNLFVGTGFRTDSQAVNYLKAILKENVIELNLVDERFYHLDICLFVLDNKYAFYYPPAFSKKSVKVIKSVVKNLIELKKDDLLSFAANSVSVGKNVIIQSGSKHFAGMISKLGYTPIMLNVSEFIKAGGGIHCLTQTLN